MAVEKILLDDIALKFIRNAPTWFLFIPLDAYHSFCVYYAFVLGFSALIDLNDTILA
jgi:hypothetical protein